MQSQSSLLSALLEESSLNNQAIHTKPEHGSIQASKLEGPRLSGVGKLEKGIGLKKELVESVVLREKNTRVSVETGRSQKDDCANTLEIEELISSEVRLQEEREESMLEIRAPDVIPEAGENEEVDSPRRSR